MATRLGLVPPSGDLDSTAAATPIHQGYDLSAVTVHADQVPAREVESAALVTTALGQQR